MDFFVFSVGLTLGIGTIWRFPIGAYTHGGGAYLIAYGTLLLVMGLPLLFLELVLGQYSRVGPVLVGH